jgi:hypothetical protein
VSVRLRRWTGIRDIKTARKSTSFLKKRSKKFLFTAGFDTEGANARGKPKFFWFFLFTKRTAFLLLFLPRFAHAAPAADLWPEWLTQDPTSTAVIDHIVWTSFLARYVRMSADGINRVAYGQVPPAGLTALRADVARLEAVRIDDYARPEQRAYWMDLYNEETVALVLSHYPVASIRDIDGGLFRHGPWDEKVLQVEGRPLSLNDIEHRILRPIWHDPLTHYGLNCASLGCPNMMTQAFTGANVAAMLAANARDYVNDPAHVSVAADGVEVSSIYVWYQADFGGTDQGVIDHLRQYAAPALRTKLAAVHAIAGHQYDWDLNAAR